MLCIKFYLFEHKNLKFQRDVLIKLLVFYTLTILFLFQPRNESPAYAVAKMQTVSARPPSSGGENASAVITTDSQVGYHR